MLLLQKPMDTNHSVIGIRKWFLFFRTNTSNTYNYTHEKKPQLENGKIYSFLQQFQYHYLQTKLQLKKVVFATLDVVFSSPPFYHPSRRGMHFRFSRQKSSERNFWVFLKESCAEVESFFRQKMEANLSAFTS